MVHEGDEFSINLQLSNKVPQSFMNHFLAHDRNK